jgi:hypothetical protein
MLFPCNRRRPLDFPAYSQPAESTISVVTPSSNSALWFIPFTIRKTSLEREFNYSDYLSMSIGTYVNQNLLNNPVSKYRVEKINMLFCIDAVGFDMSPCIIHVRIISLHVQSD